MPQLFTYTIPVDDGAAPNPFWGMCTLAICKPKIRKEAKVGDWVAGLGSKNAPSGDLSGRLVYAMKVDEVLTMQQYDQQAATRWPHRIPDVASADLSTRLGDCIYDYSSGQAVQRRGVHGVRNIETDLGGEKVLISKDVYYFGSRAISLPDYLKPICHQTQGHRRPSNATHLEPFVAWIKSLKLQVGQIYGWPDFIVDWATIASCSGRAGRELDEDGDGHC